VNNPPPVNILSVYCGLYSLLPSKKSTFGVLFVYTSIVISLSVPDNPVAVIFGLSTA
jgi:hypothetical protein